MLNCLKLTRDLIVNSVWHRFALQESGISGLNSFKKFISVPHRVRCQISIVTVHMQNQIIKTYISMPIQRGGVCVCLCICAYNQFSCLLLPCCLALLQSCTLVFWVKQWWTGAAWVLERNGLTQPHTRESRVRLQLSRLTKNVNPH